MNTLQKECPPHDVKVRSINSGQVVPDEDTTCKKCGLNWQKEVRSSKVDEHEDNTL